MNRSALCSLLAEKGCELSGSTLFVIFILGIILISILWRPN